MISVSSKQMYTSSNHKCAVYETTVIIEERDRAELMAELNQNLMNTIEAPKGRVTVQLQPNRYAKEPSKKYFGRTVRNTQSDNC